MADAMLRAIQAPWADHLTEAEKDALDEYKGKDGRAINLVLRSNMVAGPLARTAALLRNALVRAEAPADIIAWRGIDEAEAALYAARGSANTVLTTAFLSTSLDRAQAQAIANRQNGGTLVKVLIRKGTPGVAYIHPFPRYRFPQYEVLVNAGSLLRVIHADPDPMQLEVIDETTNE